MAGTCKDNHLCVFSDVTFINESADTVIYAYKYMKNSRCYLDGWKIAPLGEYRTSSPVCDEEIDDNSKVLEIFVADPAQFINHNMVHCDSILQKHPLLKHYHLSENELRYR